MERCPNCRARADDSTEQCRRCGMELALLQRTEQAAESWLREGIRLLAAGDRGAAEQALQRALTLRTDPLATHLIDFLRSTAARPD